MKKFVVTLHYTVAPAVPGRRDDRVMADLLGSDHRFSLLGSDVLAVCVRVRAESPGGAVQLLDRRVRALWPMLAAGTLTLATATANGDLVPVGVRATRTRPGRPRLFGGRLREWPWDEGPEAGPDDESGGTAGVREPRRPKTPPGGLSAALEEPTH